MNTHPNYEIFEELGRGASTIVYRAYDRNLKRYVAIKTLADAASEDDARRDRFFRQAQFLANINHANVLRVYALEHEQGWMVMEQMAASMQDRLQARPVRPEIAVSVLKQALQALDFIHGQGRIHGSIRPSNILVDDAGMVKLSDFSGLSADGGLEAPDSRLSRYVPPEIWDEGRFGPIGKQLDFYCLGVSVLECLFGKSLDECMPGLNPTSPPEVRWGRWHTSSDHDKSISQLLAQVPAELQLVLQSMLMQKSPERPVNAGQIISKVGAAPIVAVDIPETVKAAAAVAPPSSFPEPARTTDAPAFALHSATAPAGPVPISSSQSAKQTWPPVQKPLVQKALNKNPKTSDKDQKNFRLIAIVTLAIAAVIGLALQRVVSPAAERYSTVIETVPKNASVMLIAHKQSQEIPGEHGLFKIHLAKGKHAIRIEADGYETLDASVEVASPKNKEGESTDGSGEKVADPNRFAFTLEPRAVLVEFASVQPGLEISEGTKVLKPVGNTGKYALKPGEHTLEFKKKGFLTRSETVTVGFAPLKFSVAPLRIPVEITTIPSDASVSIPSAELVAGSANRYAMSEGEHLVVATKEGYANIRQKIIVSPDKNRFSFELTRSTVLFDIVPAIAVTDISIDGLPLTKRLDGKYEMNPGSYTLELAVSATKRWTQDIEVYEGMEAVHITEPSKATAGPAQGANSAINGKNTLAETVRVNVFPATLRNPRLVFDGNSVELVSGEGAISVSELNTTKNGFEYKLTAEGISAVEGFVERTELEGQGETAAIEISIPLTNRETARRIWLMARPLAKKSPQDAVASLTKAIELDPELYQAYRDRAVALDQLGEIRDAETDLETALRELPDDYLALSVGGVVAVKSGRYSVAKDRLDRAIRKHPKRTSARIMRAQLAYQLDDKETAKGDLIALLDLTREPDQLSYVKSLLGTIAVDLGDVKLGLSLFAEAVEILESAELSTTVPQFNKAKALLDLARQSNAKDAEVARDIFLMAKQELLLLIKEPDTPVAQVFSMLADIEAYLGNNEVALEYFNRVIDGLKIVSPSLLNDRAKVNEALGNNDAANADRESAQKLKASGEN